MAQSFDNLNQAFAKESPNPFVAVATDIWNSRCSVPPMNDHPVNSDPHLYDMLHGFSLMHCEQTNAAASENAKIPIDNLIAAKNEEPGMRFPMFGDRAQADQAESSAAKLSSDRVADAELQKTVQGILKDFGNEDYQTREKAETAAKKLPIDALKYLKDGLNDESPEVRIRTIRAMKALERGHVAKCLEPVKALNEGLLDMALADKLTPELRKKFEEKIKLADSLKIPQKDLDFASKLCKLPDYGSPDFMKRLDEKYQLRDALDLKAELRLQYARKLADTNSPADMQKALELMKEAIKLKGWEKSPGYIVDAVDKMGGVETMPKEIQEAFKAAQQTIQEYNKQRPGPRVAEPLLWLRQAQPN
ncbi:MAG TPA: hypothetical protein V6C69_09435 [Trichormus sp.]